MTSLTRSAAQWFWNPDIWLPPNVTWDSFTSRQVVAESRVLEPGDFARFSDLWYPIPLALVVMCLRHAVEQFCFRPLGLRLGLKERERPQPRDNPVLERAHRAGAWHMPALAREAGVTNIQVQWPWC